MDYPSTQLSLLLRLRDLNDQDAWRDFERRYAALIIRYCRRRGLQPMDAEDVRQGVMIGLVKALPNFDYDPERGRFRHYLGAAVRRAIAAQQSQRPPQETASLDDVIGFISENTDTRDAEWDREWLLHHYRLAMDTIRERFRPRTVEVFARLVAGASIEETARSLDMSLAAVEKIKTRITQRARRLIAAQIRHEDGDAAGVDSDIQTLFP